MKTLLLGGTGFVGKSILNLPSVNNELGDITLSSRSHPTYLPSGVSFERWDLLEVSSLAPTFDLIIHAGTPAEFNYEYPRATYDAMMTSTHNLIEFVERFSNPPRLLFLSSGAVYGDMPEGTSEIPEAWNTDYEPDLHVNPYARGKIDSESLFRFAHSEGKCHLGIARLFAFSGPHLPLNRHFAIGNFVNDAIHFRKIVVRGDGQSIRTYLDSRDMASWLTKIAMEGTSVHPYHVGSEIPISIRDLALTVSRLAEDFLKVEIPIEVLGQKSSTDGVSTYIPSTAITRAEMNVSETISLEESIIAMLQDASS